MAEAKLFEVETTMLSSVVQSLNTTEKLLDDDVIKVKQWFKTQPHLPEVMDDKMIQNFLILNKCNINQTKSKITMYYKVRSKLPEIFDQINPQLPSMERVLDLMYLVPLPKLTKELYRVFVMKVRDDKTVDDLHPYDILRHVVNLQEIRLREDVAFGDVFIIDGQNVSLKYLTKITPRMMFHTYVTIYKKVFSARVKAVYLVRTPAFVKTLLAIARLIIKPKLFQRIHVCQDTSVLMEQLGKEILPEDYGGDQQSLESIQNLLKVKFNKYQNRFDQLDLLRVDKNLKPEELQNDNGPAGFCNNFKKREID